MKVLVSEGRDPLRQVVELYVVTEAPYNVAPGIPGERVGRPIKFVPIAETVDPEEPTLRMTVREYRQFLADMVGLAEKEGLVPWRGRISAMEAHITDLRIMRDRLLGIIESLTSGYGVLASCEGEPLTSEEILGNLAELKIGTPYDNIVKGHFTGELDGRIEGSTLTTGIVPHATKPRREL